MSNFLKNITVLSVTTLIMIIIGEIIIGIFYQQRLVFPPFYEKDDKYGFSLKNSDTFIHKDYMINNKVILNKNGYRSHSEADSMEKDKKTILFIGDSFTFGQGVNYEDTFVGKISKYYNSFQVINASVPGWGPIQYEKVLDEYLNKDIVISSVVIGYFPYNDLYDARRDYSRIKIFEGKLVSNSTTLSFWNKLKIKLVHKSQILMLIYRLKRSTEKMKLIGEKKIEVGSNFSKLFYGDVKTLREYGTPAQNKILKMSHLCKENKIPLIVLTFSSEHGFTDRESQYNDNRIDYSFPTQVLSDDLKNKGVNVIDFWPLMNDKCYLIQDAHYNSTGHDIVFNVLNSMLVNNI